MAKKFGDQNFYIPQRGDIVWIELDSSQGAEMRKTRPALVVSPLSYNKKVGLALFCPITGHQKGYPFEVVLTLQNDVKSIILADQVKSLDWKVRNAKFKEKVSFDVMNEVIEKLSVLISLR